MSKISIIVPVYRAEQYLNRCVESILAQTFTDFELILVDDGSPDNCPQMCDAWAEKDFRIKVVHQVNFGQATARNVGVNVSKSSYITFVDSDDAIHPQFLEFLYKAIKNNNADISFCGDILGELPKFKNIDLDEAKVNCCVMTEEKLIELFYSKRHMYGVVWGKLIRKDLVLKYPFTAGRIFEDSALVCKWLYYAKKIIHVDYDMYYYFYNTNGTIHSTFNEKRLDILWSMEEQSGFYRSIGYNDMYYIVVGQHLISSVECYNCGRLAGISKQILKAIKKKSKKMYRKYYKKIKLSKNQHIYIAETFYPIAIGIYWRIVAIKRKFKCK